MLVKLNVPANSDVEPIAAMMRAARRGSKEKFESESTKTFYRSNTRAGMAAYKKPSPETTVEVADGKILPVDGFGTIVLNLGQLGDTTKLGRMGAVAYVPVFSRNLLSTLKAAEQWGKSLISCRTNIFLGSRKRCCLFSTSVSARD